MNTPLAVTMVINVTRPRVWRNERQRDIGLTMITGAACVIGSGLGAAGGTCEAGVASGRVKTGEYTIRLGANASLGTWRRAIDAASKSCNPHTEQI
jgi:hypothetical protein